MKKVFKVEIDCAVCAQKVSDAIKKIDGVNDCNINFITQKMVIDIEDERFNSVLKEAVKVGRKIEPDFGIE